MAKFLDEQGLTTVWGKIKELVNSKIAAADALIYKGTVSSKVALPTADVMVGHTYKVSEAGTYAGKVCEVGDMIIASSVTKGASGAADTIVWDVIQTNLLTATSSVAGVVKLGSDTKQTVAAATPTATSGKTYAVQADSNGKMVVNVPWTNTTYTAGSVAGKALGTAAVGTSAKYAREDHVHPMPTPAQVGAAPSSHTHTAATSSVGGFIKLGSDTAQTVAANSVSATADRTYAVQANSNGQMVVNVPWTDKNTTYTASSATPKALGTAAAGSSAEYSRADHVHPLPTPAAIGAATSSHTHDAATDTTGGFVKLGSKTAQTVAANSVTSTASRTYAVQANSSGQMVVNVPWTDTNTNTTNTTSSAATTGTKLFIVGASSQASSVVTQSDAKCYIGTDDCLYSNGAKVLTSHQSLADYAKKADHWSTSELTAMTTAEIEDILV